VFTDQRPTARACKLLTCTRIHSETRHRRERRRCSTTSCLSFKRVSAWENPSRHCFQSHHHRRMQLSDVASPIRIWIRLRNSKSSGHRTIRMSQYRKPSELVCCALVSAVLSSQRSELKEGQRSLSDCVERKRASKTLPTEFHAKPDQLKKCLSLDVIESCSNESTSKSHTGSLKGNRRRAKPTLEKREPVIFTVCWTSVVLASRSRFYQTLSLKSKMRSLQSSVVHCPSYWFTLPKVCIISPWDDLCCWLLDENFMADWSLVTIFLIGSVENYLPTLLREYRRYLLLDVVLFLVFVIFSIFLSLFHLFTFLSSVNS
jgi:hypothetical protein